MAVERPSRRRYLIAPTFVVLAVAWMAFNAFSVTHRHHPSTFAVSVDELDDANASLSIFDLVRERPSGFHKVGTAAMGDASIRWFRFMLPRAMPQRVVVSADGVPNEADLYFPRPDGTYGDVSFGERRPFDRRYLATPYVAVEVTPGMRTGAPLYIRTSGAESSYDEYLPLIFRSREAFDRYQWSQTSGTAAFVGFFFAMGLISAFLGLYLRERMFALHAVLMLVVIIWDLTENLLAWQFVWPFASVSFRMAENVTFMLYLLVLLLFARSFLTLEKTLPALDRALWIIFALDVAVIFVADPLLAPGTLSGITISLQFLPFLLLLVGGTLRWRAGFRQARFFVLGFAGLFVVFLTAVLFSDAPLSPWAIGFGVACESLFFQFAIADRMLSVVRDRDHAQRNALMAQVQLAEDRRSAIEQLERYNEAFSRFVPREFLTQLGHQDVVSVRLGECVESCMTILFTDIRGFTRLAEQLPADQTFTFVNEFLKRVGPVIRSHGGFVDKFIGDGMLALFPGAADDAVDAAIELHQTVRRFNESRARALLAPVGIGVGLHYGHVMLGTVGDEKRFETTVIADAVNLASRLEGLNKTFGAQIIVSVEVVDALANRGAFRLRPLCPVQVRGASREIAVYEVCDADEPELLLHKVATLEVFESGIAAYVKGDLETSARMFAEVLRHNEKDAPAAYFLAQIPEKSTAAKSKNEP